MATFISHRKMTTNEIREVLHLMENQDTTDKFTNLNGTIDGNDAKIEVIIDEDGNVELI